MRAKVLLFILFISLTLVIAPAFAIDKSTQKGHQNTIAAFADLMQTFSSRPNATTPATAQILENINQDSGKAMFAELAKNQPMERIDLFATKLPSIIAIFNESYPNSQLGNDERAAITNEFYMNLLDAAELSDIPYEQFNLAYLKAGSCLEEMLTGEPAISLEDQELVNLLLTSTYYQLQFRTYFRNLFAAFTVIEPVDFFRWPNILSNLQLVEANVHSVYLSSLEDILSDQLILADATALRSYQFNLAAQADMNSVATLLMLYVTIEDDNFFFLELISRMQAVGGVMSNMTVETLFSSGVVFNFLPVTEAAIYNWISTGSDANYKLLAMLPAQIEELGAEVRIAPDFSLFEKPYQSFFQLVYDYTLAHDLFRLKCNKLSNDVLSIEMRLANMRERYELLNEKTKLTAKLFKRLTGVKVIDKKAIRDLLAIPCFF